MQIAGIDLLSSFLQTKGEIAIRSLLCYQKNETVLCVGQRRSSKIMTIALVSILLEEAAAGRCMDDDQRHHDYNS